MILYSEPVIHRNVHDSLLLKISMRWLRSDDKSVMVFRDFYPIEFRNITKTMQMYLNKK